MPNTKPKGFVKKQPNQPKAKGTQGLQSATNVALMKFQNASKKTDSSASQASPVAPNEISKPPTLCLRLPVVLKFDYLAKAYAKKPEFVVDQVLDLMKAQPAFAARIIEKHKRREELLRKYSFGRDILDEQSNAEETSEKEDDGFMEVENQESKPPVKREAPSEKQKKKSAKREAKSEKQRKKTEKKGESQTGVEVVKNSLPLMRSYVLSFDSKSKCKPEHAHKNLKAGDADFWVILMAKFYSFAQHALPLMEDPETDFHKKQRDQVCLASSGCKYETLTNYRDVIWLRCSSKPTHDKYAKKWKDQETKTSRKGPLHKSVKTAIKEFKASKAHKSRKTNLKLQDLFLAVFPHFRTSPIYNL